MILRDIEILPVGPACSQKSYCFAILAIVRLKIFADQSLTDCFFPVLRDVSMGSMLTARNFSFKPIIAQYGSVEANVLEIRFLAHVCPISCLLYINFA